jgi:hypothetical protein
MRAPSIRIRRVLFRSGGPIAVLLAGTLVWQGSNAAFTAETHNNSNSWNAGSVTLSNDAGGAMFALTNLTPGATGSKCIVVTATSTVTGVVKTYVQALTAGGLENNITVSIQQGTGGSFADCAGFSATATVAAQPLATLFASNGTYGNGVLPWSKGTGAQSKTYMFTWLFDTTGLTQTQIDALQGTSVSANFEWELQNS